MSMQELDIIQETVLNYSNYQGQGSYGVTSLEQPRYRMQVEKDNPGVDCTPPTNRVDSLIGTGFHAIAEEALNASDLPLVTEQKLKADIKGYIVGGTCDIVYTNEDGSKTVGDWKTMKAFPAKKALNGEHDKFIKQLSLYAYMLRQAGDKTTSTGTIYVVVTGWTMRDKAIPRTFRIDVPLMTDKEVEDYVVERITMLDNPEFDCPVWMCKDYCGVRDVCPHHNNAEFKA